MARLADVVGVARVTCKATASGVPIINVFHVSNGPAPYNPWAQADLTTMLAAFNTAWSTRMLPLVASQYTVGTIEAIDLSSATGVTGSIVMTGTAGGGTGVTTPNSAAVCIGWKIPRHYKGGHPRTYMGPIAGAAITSPTTLLGTYRTTVQNNASGFLNDISLINSGAAKLVTVHRKSNKVVLTVPLVDQITGVTVDDRIDSQRRRLGRDR